MLLPAELLDGGQSFGRRPTAPVTRVAGPLVQFATYDNLSDARHVPSLPLLARPAAHSGTGLCNLVNRECVPWEAYEAR